MENLIRVLAAIALVVLIGYSTTTHSYEIDEYGVKRMEPPQVCSLFGENKSKWFQDTDENTFWSCYNDIYLDTDSNGISYTVIGDEDRRVIAAWSTSYILLDSSGGRPTADASGKVCAELQERFINEMVMYSYQTNFMMKVRCTFGEVPEKYLINFKKVELVLDI